MEDHFHTPLRVMRPQANASPHFLPLRHQMGLSLPPQGLLCVELAGDFTQICGAPLLQLSERLERDIFKEET